jgi:predicted Rossmann fold flavoprotein
MSATPDPVPAKPALTGAARLRIAIIGGGAAGFFTAINTAEKNPAAAITIFEAGHKPLQKVRISGGGRCNLTHHCFDPVRLVEFYPRGQRELKSLFARFQPENTVQWFEKRGVKMKTEPDGRMFPRSDTSGEVLELFHALAKRHDIRIHNQSRVERIQKMDAQFEVTTTSRQTERFDVCVLATGYSPTGWELAKALGHTVLPPVPSLFPFTIHDAVLKDLQGIALPQAKGKLVVKGTHKTETFTAEGPVLITHTGLSGPLIYRLSAWGARSLAESRYQALLTLDCLPTQSEDALRAELQHLLAGPEGKKKLGNLSFAALPNRLWQALLVESGANPEEKVETLGKKTLNRLVENLKRLPLQVTGKSPSKEEFVSCGGVALKEVDFKTLQSKCVPGLYFGGEILDIDGLTGGFNFQACWSAGWVISEALKAL